MSIFDIYEPWQIQGTLDFGEALFGKQVHICVFNSLKVTTEMPHTKIDVIYC